MPKKLSKVTIVIPIFKVEKYIERCARSLFEQTYKNIDYIFVDDCSPDNSVNILNRIIEDYPERKSNVSIIHHKCNMGLGAVRNTGVYNCHTEFIMHVDSDDSLEVNAVEMVIKTQEEGNYDIVKFGFKMFYSFNKIKNISWPIIKDPIELSKMTLARQVPVCVWNGLYRTSLYKDNGIEVVFGINNSEDYCVTPRLAYYAKRICSLSDSLYNYYVGNENAYTRTFSEEKSRQSLKAFEINESFFRGKKEFITSLELGRSAVYVGQILGSLRSGKNADYYYEMKNKGGLIQKRYIKSLNIFYRYLLYVDNYRVASSLYIISRWLYRMYYKLNNRYASIFG